MIDFTYGFKSPFFYLGDHRVCWSCSHCVARVEACPKVLELCNKQPHNLGNTARLGLCNNNSICAVCSRAAVGNEIQ